MNADCRLPKRPRKSRKAGDIEAVRLKIWRALSYAEWGMNRAAFAEDMTEMRAFIHALSQAAGQYAKIIEAGEMAADIELLKAQLPMRRVA